MYILRLMKISMHTLRRLRFAFITLVAVLCLLSVQHGAAFHALSHLADEDSTESQKQLPHKVCDKCIAYAEASGAVPTTVLAPLQIPTQLIAIASAEQTLFPSLTYPVYSARAPPISL